MLAGVLVGTYVGHRRGIPLGQGLNAVAPALPLAQAIGRWGNWFNQELYGKPTDLPWAVEIDPEHRVAGYEAYSTFHPTFLYESLWNLALCGLLLWIDKRFRPAGGRLLAMYVLGYGIGRFWIEGLRIDEADELGRPALEPVGRRRLHRRRWPVPAGDDPQAHSELSRGGVGEVRAPTTIWARRISKSERSRPDEDPPRSRSPDRDPGAG